MYIKFVSERYAKLGNKVEFLSHLYQIFVKRNIIFALRLIAQASIPNIP